MMGERKPLKRKNRLEPKDIPFVSICCLEKDFSKYLDLKGFTTQGMQQETVGNHGIKLPMNERDFDVGTINSK